MKLPNSHILGLFVRDPTIDEDGRFCFVGPDVLARYREELKSDANRLKTRLKAHPWLYYFLLYFASTIFFGGLSAKRAIERIFGGRGIPEDKVVVNLGSGPRRYYKGVLNIDLYPFRNVDIVADASDLPFKDNCVDMVVAESLMEHLPRPGEMVEEITRVVKPGGYVYGLVPFLYPFHSSPNDYYRWTAAGIRESFADWEVIEIGMRSGPVSALLSTLTHALALIFSFGVDKLYLLLVNVFMLLLAPLKVFDALFFLFPKSSEAASFLYFFLRKRGRA